MTGKTSLGQLLEDKFLKLDEVQNGSACVFRISLAWMQRYAKLMGMSWDDFLDQCGHKKWKSSRHGHSPVNNLSKKNKWGYEDICFTKEEFHDYFYNFCKVHINDKLIKNEIPCLFNYVSDITAYHPGLVA
ncbi:unnamed protein product [Rhizophagus irregularis]|nr:unnamed protein product [Rhizophagus irregularis]CAB4409535.1 unnamed protein product [Rhizophagus irregularis]